jgi:hypothetical protein
MWQRPWIALCAVLVGAADQPPNPSFYLVNRGVSAITRIYTSPAGMPNWGTNQLPGAAVAVGQNTPIRLAADGTCMYDIRIIYASGASDERRDVNTCEIDNIIFPRSATATSGHITNRTGRVQIPSFLLVNRARTAMNELYLSPTGDDSWGEDQLGAGMLAIGASRTIRLPMGECLYDYRVVFANGDANEKRRVNLCQIIELRLP